MIFDIGVSGVGISGPLGREWDKLAIIQSGDEVRMSPEVMAVDEDGGMLGDRDEAGTLQGFPLACGLVQGCAGWGGDLV
jgi:hypothetical protein